MSENTASSNEVMPKAGKIAKILGIMVAIPSIINMIGDIWISLNNLPVGDKEKVNNALFREHFGDSPVHAKKIIIDVAGKKMPLDLEVYYNGNIFLKYGGEGQWFASSNLHLSSNQFSLISTAHADETPLIQKEITPAPVLIINEINEDNDIVRSKVLIDGSIEKTTLDQNTAKTLSIEVIPAPKDIEETIIIEPTEIITIPEKESEPVEVIVIDEQN